MEHGLIKIFTQSIESVRDLNYVNDLGWKEAKHTELNNKMLKAVSGYVRCFCLEGNQI